MSKTTETLVAFLLNAPKVDIETSKVDIESLLSGKDKDFSAKTVIHIHRLFEKFGFDAHVAMEKEVSKDTMKILLKDALDFVRYSGKQLYCGEFGVINAADAAAWLLDVRQLFDENKIGHAIWNYKELDFGFVDLHNVIKQPDCQKAIFDK